MSINVLGREVDTTAQREGTATTNTDGRVGIKRSPVIRYGVITRSSVLGGRRYVVDLEVSRWELSISVDSEDINPKPSARRLERNRGALVGEGIEGDPT